MPEPTSGGDKTVVVDQSDGFPEGTRLNDTYVIDGKLALGGMAEVYRGRNIHTDEPVAIKIVLPEYSRESTVVALFRKEALVLNRLSHEAIVRYLAFTIEPSLKRPYMVMEFVDGISLLERLQSKALDADETRIVIWRVASGLAAAHQAGVIHRDLSPDNVILPGGDPGRAKVIDFGIAKSTSGDPTLLGGKFAGKYNFVSPEQLGLFGAEVTERSDIYGLGLIAAAANLGRPLDMSGSHMEVIDKRRVVPDLTGVDETLRPLIAKMLEPDPANRPASMSEVLEQLIALGLPPMVHAGSWPGGPPPRGKTIPPRNPTIPPENGTVIADAPGGNAQPASESPFGPYDGAKAGGWQAPGIAVDQKKSRGKGGLIAGLVLVLLAVGGAGAYFAGLLDPYLAGAKPDIAARIAALPPQDCLYIAPVGQTDGTNVSVSAISSDAAVLSSVSAALGGEADPSVTVATSQVEPTQCAIVNLLAGNGAAVSGTALDLSTDALISNDIMDGTIVGPSGWTRAAFIIDNTGMVYNITALLRGAPTGPLTFRMRLQSQAPLPVPQIVLAVYSPTPLDSTQLKAPIDSAAFAAGLSAEIAGGEQQVAIRHAFFRILPE